MAIANADLKGAGELLLVTTDFGSDAVIEAWDGATFSLLWRRSLGSVTVNDLFNADLDGDGEEELVVLGHVGWSAYPTGESLLLIASQTTASFWVEYQNTGHWGSIDGITSVDLDQDGIKEVLFGSGSLIQVNKVVPRPSPPTVDLRVDPSSGAAPLMVNFTAMATAINDGPLSYAWDFGDGTVRNGAAEETHTFPSIGVFMVGVTVSDGRASSTASLTVDVTERDYFGLYENSTITYLSRSGAHTSTTALLDALDREFLKEGIFPTGTTQEYYTRREAILELSRWVGIAPDGSSSLDLSHGPAAIAFKEPLVEGLRWSGTARVTGTLNDNLPLTGSLAYTVQVGKSRAAVETPVGIFLAFKVKSQLRYSLSVVGLPGQSRLKAKAVEWFVPYLGVVKSVGSGRKWVMTDYAPRWPAPIPSRVSPSAVSERTRGQRFTLFGANFFEGATVLLRKPGRKDLRAKDVLWISATELRCTIDIGRKTAGAWDVMVQNPGTEAAVLPEAVEILPR